MGIADFCVRNPVSVTVGILLAVLFGTIALLRLPIQMIPTVDRPRSRWRRTTAAPPPSRWSAR